ncbi:aspartate ammonia-lyase [Mycolicibacterium sp. P1-18]|uniref:aspartate ammonia-lyase n=1 Tax=Mycolicibacterium sp. P1-18 TaxID=2024615 RepID=UPI0011F1DCCA|nr:aspartate ammonia-lyase [Mycolicibacterium sp. P1-18]KAA0099014.1 aspartate ammonia-lyase [Mycolicibacterium sp. P1-18]
MTRIEHDLLGERELPDDAYYGIHTLRALENFAITGIPLSHHADLVTALVSVKEAAAMANTELGLVAQRKGDVIVEVCREIRGGALRDQFVVDVFQGGAGTSTNMNANEVIANRALELLGHRRGDYHFLHPLEDVNRSQSTNDVYPTAIKTGLQKGISRLSAAITALAGAFSHKAVEFADVLKVGRTQLQDAVPMTLGQEVATFAVMLLEDVQRLDEAAQLITEINLGGTAIGTGVNTHPSYAGRVREHLIAVTGIQVCTASDLIEATQDVGAFVQLSGVLKRAAVKLSKICNDLRLLSSGPRAGFCEINLPPVQAGSSIMPGKVNPVIPEVVNQIAFRVVGNDLVVTMAAEGGQLQLNAFEPVIAHSLFETVELLTKACDVLRVRCVTGITANTERLAESVANSIGIATALNPYIGYTAATQLAADALARGRAVSDLAVEQGLISEERLAIILSPANLVKVGAIASPPDLTFDEAPTCHNLPPVAPADVKGTA